MTRPRSQSMRALLEISTGMRERHLAAAHASPAGTGQVSWGDPSAFSTRRNGRERSDERVASAWPPTGDMRCSSLFSIIALLLTGCDSSGLPLSPDSGAGRRAPHVVNARFGAPSTVVPGDGTGHVV